MGKTVTWQGAISPAESVPYMEVKQLAISARKAGTDHCELMQYQKEHKKTPHTVDECEDENG